MSLATDILVLSPLENSDGALVSAAQRAGALGVLDLGRDKHKAIQALETLAKRPAAEFGVRLPDGADFDPALLPEAVSLVVLPAGVPVAAWKPRRVLVQVTSLAEAQAALAYGADGIIAKGSESGGRVGLESSFVLLQRLVSSIDAPVWVQGGIGQYTAAAAISGGAVGVVLDSQVALVRESTLPESTRAFLRSADGGETGLYGGWRLHARPEQQPDEDIDAKKLMGRFGLDPASDLLVCGQDVAFALPLAERFQTLGGVVRGLRRAIYQQIRLSKVAKPLAPGSALAQSHGTKYPIVQGPMTRVSDTAAFADAVSQNGALPFLALALMRGPEVHRLLEETSKRLEGRSWGVGVLGFVPPELREEQMAVIQEMQPPFAIIAGGRPAQAKPLEDAGTKTYIHVPSPGLLDMFLKQGSRDFVFEGQECGGHIGPRSSFVLWEQQVERLMRFEQPSELSVLFAGGIHDAKSAAMVSVLAAPLAEKGAKVGVLMGTAYLFTNEAVEAGAILPAYQEAALACDETALLETAPGHMTRCADTEYVRTFISERDRLRAEGLPSDEVWAALETLNLGRLRIASKGLTREGDVIVNVDEEGQRREGMIMLGEVAALQQQVRGMADLHADVSEGVERVLAAVQQANPDSPPPESEGIAIVGLSAIMPGAPDLETFWANIVNSVNSITEVSPERWDPETFFDPNSQSGAKTPSKWGGFVQPTPFDPALYGIPPLSLAAIEPVQLLALEVSRRALADANYIERDFNRERTSVIFGAEGGTDLAGAYGFRAMWQKYAGDIPPELDAVLPTMTEDSFPGMLTNVISGRITNRLDLGGANYTVDAACASALAAVDLACKELRARSSDMVICGGADLHNSVLDYLAFSSVHALSASGQCRTFDANADGIVLGEGVAALVLKRVSDAERDGDRIYAVIKGVGSGSDGKSLGMTAPSQGGQVRTLDRAYALAGVSPAQVQLIEAHGTGTVVGDRTELETLHEVFHLAGAESDSCVIGSVKSIIGHTKCTAGLAGLIKAALALYNRVLPATANVESPNPGWDPDGPFAINTSPRPWTASDRKAGISSFGFGGTNFHAVLAEYEQPAPESGLTVWPSELFLFRGATPAEALKRVALVEGLLDAERPWRLKDLAATVARDEGAVQIAIVASDTEDLRGKLADAAKLQNNPQGIFVRDQSGVIEGKLAFLFPGQGSQRVDMLRDIFVAFPQLQEHLSLGERWAKTMFPSSPWDEATKARQTEAITDTRVAQPALGIGGMAMSQLLQQVGLKPDVLAGHSYGELVALTTAGVMSEEALLSLSQARAEAILTSTAQAGDKGTMAAVAASVEQVTPYLKGIKDVVPANQNAPEQTVISGPTAGIEIAMQRLKEAGIAARGITVACAFHSPLVEAACDIFGEVLEGVELAPPQLPVFSNTTAKLYPKTPAAIRKRLAEHIGKPVKFVSEVEAMYEAGVRVFVEAGSGRTLSGLVGQILGSKPHLAVSFDQAGRNGITQLLLGLAQLAVNGIEIDTAPLFAGRTPEVFDLENPSARKLSPLTWWVDGYHAWPMQGELPSHAMKPVLEPVVRAGGAAVPALAAGSQTDMVVMEYLRSVRELVETQRSVMLSYLGTPVMMQAPIEGQVVSVSSQAETRALEPVAAAQPPVPVDAAGPVDVEQTLLKIVSDRTGYPVTMLGLDLDLEADLSIDSIKRIEVLGSLLERIGFAGAGGGGDLPEELVRVKTLRGILQLLSELAEAADGGDEPQQIAAAESRPALPAASAPLAIQARPGRFVFEMEAAPVLQSDRTLLRNLTVGIVGQAALSDALSDALTQGGARPTLLDAAATPAGLDALVDVSALAPDWQPGRVVEVFERARDALAAGTLRVLIACQPGGPFAQNLNGDSRLEAGGLPGMVKSLAQEWPEATLKVMHVYPGERAKLVSDSVVGELTATDDVMEVGYVSGQRQRLRLERTDDLVETTGGLSLDKGSVVLITGGARGITARVALELATRYSPRIEIVGRTQLPEAQETAEIAAAADAPALRRVLIGQGAATPAAIEAQVSSILGTREVRASLQALRDAGAQVEYHSLDIRDDAAFGELIDAIYTRHGRIDLVIHGAGVIEDAQARDKTRDSFQRVFDTKVAPAMTLAEKLRPDVAAVVFFSSVAAPFGNRGQTDYAAANDFLDKMASALNTRLPGRVFSINWGPWADGGMVSPELSREFAARGIQLIDPQSGVDSFLDELLHGPAGESQVVLMPGEAWTTNGALIAR